MTGTHFVLVDQLHLTNKEYIWLECILWCRHLPCFKVLWLLHLENRRTEGLPIIDDTK